MPNNSAYFSLDAEAVVQVVDVIVKIVLGGLFATFMFGIVAGMVDIGRAVILDFVERDPDHALFAVGRHGRNALGTLMPWRRRLFLVWLSMLFVGITWIVIRLVLEGRT